MLGLKRVDKMRNELVRELGDAKRSLSDRLNEKILKRNDHTERSMIINRFAKRIHNNDEYAENRPADINNILIEKLDRGSKGVFKGNVY